MFISASKTLRFSFGLVSPEPHLKRFVMECVMIYLDAAEVRSAQSQHVARMAAVVDGTLGNF
jgi:hypothetical protein